MRFSKNLQKREKMKKTNNFKKDSEEKIHKILLDFTAKTGCLVDGVEFSRRKPSGFKNNEGYETKIILNNNE